VNNEKSSTFLGILICVGFFFAYNSYITNKYDTAGEQQIQSPQNPEASPDKTQANKAPVSSPDLSQVESKENTGTNANILTPDQRLSVEQLTIENKDVVYQFNQDTGGMSVIQLKQYRQTQKPDSDRVRLNDSMMVVQPTAALSTVQAILRTGFLAKRLENSIAFTMEQGPWEMTYRYTVPESGYGLDLDVHYKNISKTSQELNAGLLMQENLTPPEAAGGLFASQYGEQTKFVASRGGERDDVDVASYCKDYPEEQQPAAKGSGEMLSYIGFDSHYFIKVLQPKNAKFDFTTTMIPKQPQSDGCPIRIALSQRQGVVQPEQSVDLAFAGFFGPKDVEILRAHNKGLEEAVNFGWFAIVAKPLLAGIKWLYALFGNYGVAIIIITIIIKTLFFPLTRAAAISARKMQKLQPQMKAIKDKHKEDPKRQQQEIMKFMQSNKINPAKGCIPILPQIPVFIALWNVLSQSIEFRHAPFAGWIQDLSSADPIYITPLLLGGFMLIQQKLTPTPNIDKTQQKVMMMMPVIFTLMFFSLPAGMVLYMIVNTIVSILQQQWLNKKLA
jgi:YidC/Oxa1 family membrane protein insertase